MSLFRQEQLLTREKVRIYALARELNMESKDLLDLCRQAGIDVKNQLSSLEPEQRDAVEQMARRGSKGGVAVAPPPPKPVSVLPNLSKDVPVLPTRAARREADGVRTVSPAAPTPTSAAEPTIPTIIPAAKTAEAPAARLPEPPKAVEVPAARAPEQASPPPDVAAKAPAAGAGKVRDLGQPREGSPRPKRTRDIPRPVVARVAQPPPLKPPPVKKEAEKKPEPTAQKPIARLPEGFRGGAGASQDLINKLAVPETPVPVVDEDEEGDKTGKSRPGGVAGRDRRHQERQNRARLRKGRTEDEGPRNRLVVSVEDERPQRLKDRIKRSQQKRLPTAPRKG